MEPKIGSIISSIKDKLHMLPQDSYGVCIYRVSEKRRRSNEEAYTPRLVSIGPLHHGKSQLQTLELYKVRCLHNFMKRINISFPSLVHFAARMIREVRGCYEETVELSPEVFAELILLDGVFIIELFLKNHFSHMRESSDVIFENQWMLNDILHDMLLIENQLPIRVACELFNLVTEASMWRLSFFDLARKYFQNVGNTGKLPVTDYCHRARHFVEFLIYLHKPLDPIENLSLGEKIEYSRSATELQEAGVQFFSGNAKCLFEVKFWEGKLIMPKLTVNDSTETLFKNLIAFEQCGYRSKDITSYVIFMDSLINTPKDVALLVTRGIIKNDLGENKQVADLFNSLHKEIMTDASEFYFAKLCGELNEYCKSYWHRWKTKWFKWKVILKHEYFSSPWSLVSVIAAIILLLLTAIQAVCSVLQVT